MLKNKIGFIRMDLSPLTLLIAAIGLVAILCSCGGSGDGGGGGTTDLGTLSVGLTDASTGEYQAVYVTIDEVQVHMTEDDWEIVGSPAETYNLLALVNGVIEQLGVADLQAGDYTQIRLIIGEDPDDELNILGDPHPFANYIIDMQGDAHELKIPSGIQTGIKLVHGFTINEGAMLELLLDFDASKSIVKAGNSGKWLLKPTIKIIDLEEAYMVSGTITDEEENPLEGVLVSAQIWDNLAADLKDQVIIQASSITEADGTYAMYLEPGAYNILAYKDGYAPAPACIRVVVETDTGGPEFVDFILNTVLTGTVSGTVIISGDDPDASATLSFRQDAVCEGSAGSETVEIKSLRVSPGDYSGFVLPEGTYAVVASSEDKTTQDLGLIVITDGDVTTVNVSF